MATLFVLKVRFFQRPFIMVSDFSQVQGPDQGPVFGRYQYFRNAPQDLF